MYGLSEMPSGKFDPCLLGKYYRLWYTTDPYDVGMTTRKALKQLAPHKVITKAVFEHAVRKVMELNGESQSNGSLMRSTPIAVYGHLLSNSDLRQAVIHDCNYTHTHINVIDSVYIYCLAIGRLIKEGLNPDRAKIAFDDAEKAC
jgi:ADP-ribosyl-[dinitrogen reductase] hydrolase